MASFMFTVALIQAYYESPTFVICCVHENSFSLAVGTISERMQSATGNICYLHCQRTIWNRRKLDTSYPETDEAFRYSPLICTDPYRIKIHIDIPSRMCYCTQHSIASKCIFLIIGHASLTQRKFACFVRFISIWPTLCPEKKRPRYFRL